MPDGVKEIVGVTPLLAAFLTLAFVSLKIVPLILAHREKIKLAEIEVRKIEAGAQIAQAEATGKLTDMLQVNAEAIDELKIFLRVATRDHETIHKRLSEIEQTLEIRASH